ncbi:hypothetical protein PVK06_022602 [Gossypium arboreum]|uniref:Uncharacterized protein n=1 Tax=Gossypium arboreum TaxID=29729 RepID=A0ABR0P902_GOSAR|nr:hypothetical protein PVK06_022602 [Gossypium arboreum]
MCHFPENVLPNSKGYADLGWVWGSGAVRLAYFLSHATVSNLTAAAVFTLTAVDASLNIRNNCKNKDLYVENLSLVLRDRPPYVPREFDPCAVAGNSGDHLKTRFEKERDNYEVVIRENGAPQSLSFGFFFFFSSNNHTEYVGKKSTIRLLNRESARGLDKVVGLDGLNIHRNLRKAIRLYTAGLTTR